MATRADGVEEIIVTGDPRPSRYYNPDAFLSQNFLKSAKFSMRLYNTAAVTADFVDVKPEDLSFLCDSVEFPGQSLTASEYRMPGKLKLKIPYLRELNEITVTFYHNTKIPIYGYFSNWIQSISPTNTYNEYFSDITTSIEIIQFDEVSGIRGFFKDIIEFNQIPVGGINTNLSKYMTVSLKNAYPLNIASMPSNWADDGFHKLTVSFFYEDLDIEFNTPNLKFKDLLDNGNIYDATTVRLQTGNFA